MNRRALLASLIVVGVMSLCPAWVAAQAGGEVGVHVSTAASSEFNSSDVGVGGRFAWRPGSWLGAEAEVSVYPSDFPDDLAFSRGRIEGLFGATLGPRVGQVRPFARLRPGFLTFREAPAPIACILIFPPPLACSLAAGQTLLVLDVGGGVEFFPTDRTFVRLDAGDRAVRYEGPAFGADRAVHQDDFFSHDFRFAIGGGVRF